MKPTSSSSAFDWASLLPALSGVGWVLAFSPCAVYPGSSAATLTGAAGLQPFVSLGYPLYGALTSLLSNIPLPLAATAVALQALMAGVTVWALARILTRSAGSLFSATAPDQFARAVAVASALTGTLFFLVTPPFVMTFAVARAETLAFALLASGLALATTYLVEARRRDVILATVLLSLSAVEHPAALLAAPFVFFAALIKSYSTKDGPKTVLLLASLGLALWFAGMTLAAARFYFSPSAEWREADTFFRALRGVFRDYIGRGPQSLPRSGWLVILIFAFLPLPFLFAPGRRAWPRLTFKDVFFNLLALPVIAAVVLLDLGPAPANIARTDSPLIFSYFAMATWVGRWSGWLLAGFLLRRAARQPIRVVSRAPFVFAAVIGLVMLAAAWRNYPPAALRILGAFRTLSTEIAHRLPPKTDLLTTAEIEDYLMIAARDAGKEVSALNLSALARLPYQRYLAGRYPEFDPDQFAAVGAEAVLQFWLIKRAESGAHLLSVMSLGAFPGGRWTEVPTGFLYRVQPSEESAVEEAGNSSDRGAIAAAREELEVLRRLKILREGNRRLPPSVAGVAEWLARHLARYANELGVAVRRAGDSSTARECFELAIMFDPSNPVAHINRLLLARAENEAVPEQLMEEARQAITPYAGTTGGQRFPLAFGTISIEPGKGPQMLRFNIEKDAESPADRFAEFFAEGRLAEALQALDAVIEADPLNIQALAERFLWRIRTNDLAGARADLAALQRAGAPQTRLQLAEAQLLLAGGKTEEAVELFRAITLKPNPPPEAYLGLAVALARAGREKEWRAALADLNRLSRGHAPSMAYLAEQALANRDLPRAREYLTILDRLEPANLRALEQLIRLDFAESRADGLIERGAALLKRAPGHPLGWYALATGYALKQEWEKALPAYEASAIVQPSHYAYHDWAWAFYQLGRKQEALQRVERALELEPAAPRSLALRGVLELELGQAEKAVRYLEEAIRGGLSGDDVKEALERARAAAPMR